MFSTVSDSSKAALDFLVTNLVSMEYQLIDCQITSSHLLSLGAKEISRGAFIAHLDQAIGDNKSPGSWFTRNSHRDLTQADI